MKSRICQLALLAACIALLPGPARAQTVTVKVVTLAPNGSIWHEALKDLNQRWREVSQGSVRMRIYPGGVAGDEMAVMAKMRIGQYGGALVTTHGLVSITKAARIFNLPRMIRSYEELDYVVERLGPRLEAEMAERGFIILDWVAGQAKFFVPEPVTSIEAVQRFKMFTWAGDTETAELWKKAGFNVVPLPATEVITGFQTGLINAILTHPSVAMYSQYFRHTPYLIDLDIAPLVAALIISRRIWERIPADLRPQLRDEARNIVARLQDEDRRFETEAIESMKKRGLSVLKPSPAEIRAWDAKADEVNRSVRGSYVPADYFDEISRLVAEFRRANRRSQGSGR